MSTPVAPVGGVFQERQFKFQQSQEQKAPQNVFKGYGNTSTSWSGGTTFNFPKATWTDPNTVFEGRATWARSPLTGFRPGVNAGGEAPQIKQGRQFGRTEQAPEQVE